MVSVGDRSLQRFVRRNIAHLARACWLAAAWQESSADAEKECDPVLSKNLWKDRNRMIRLERALKKYQAKGGNYDGSG